MVPTPANRVTWFQLFGALSVAALGVLLALAASPVAAAHPRGCAFPRLQPPVGSIKRVYAIPHGCVRLAVPADDTMLPTVVVRQHNTRGRIVTRRFPLPDSNLDRAHGGIGVCGPPEAYIFLVSYPFVAVVSQQLYDLGDRRECDVELASALLWTGQLGRLPSLQMTWWTHRAPS